MSEWLQAASPKGRFLSFKNVGDSHTIEINGVIDVREQQYQNKTVRYQSGPKEGQPKKEYLIPGLDYNAEDEASAQVILPVKEGKMMGAVGRALQAVGESQPKEGGVLTLTFTGFGEAFNGGNPPREFDATYVAPERDDASWGSDGE